MVLRFLLSQLRAFPKLAPPGLKPHNFCCGDGLSYVALGVIGDVNQQAAKCGWQLLFADYSVFFQLGWAE